jgi:tetratricopeptide (TPR) repeat protein
MILNSSRYAYHSRKKGRKRRYVFFFLFLFAAAFTAVLLTVILPALRADRVAIPGQETDIYTLWESGLYSEVATACRGLLQEDPMDPELLMYYGMAQYYRAYYENALEHKLPLLDEAISSLRRALLADPGPYRGEICYILGQAYYHKGAFYYDLTVEYIEKSLAEGYSGRNTHEYFAMAYGGLGNPEKELEHLLKAYETDPSDFILLSIGKTYLTLNEHELAKDYLLRCLNKTAVPNVEKECRFKLADIYIQNQEYLKAESQLEAIVALDPGSAEAHFQLGELYYRMDNIVKAVAQWKKTEAIDPTHYGAKRRLY